MTDHVAKLAEVLDRAREFLDLACQTTDRGEREMYERTVELYLKIAGELEVVSDRQKTGQDWASQPCL